MKIFKYCLLLVAITFFTSIQAQDVKFEISKETAAQNDEVTLDVTTDNFIDILAVQFGIGWDSLNLEFVSVQDFNTDIGVIKFNTGVPPDVRKGRLSFSWSDGNFEPQTLSNGAVLFSITLKAIGDEGSVNPVSLIPFPSKIEVVQNGEAVDPVLIDGSVTIDGTGGGDNDLEIIMPSVTVEENETICVPVTVRNFKEIGALNFGLFYDKDVLEFVETKNYNLPGLDISAFNLYEPGVLAFSYASTTGATVDDDTVMFEVCFKAIGKDGDMTDLTLGDVVRPMTTLKMEAVKIDGEEIGIDVDNGKVTIGDGSTLPFGLKISPEEIGGSGEICVPVVVQGNDALDNATFTLEWNSDLLTYVETKNFFADAAAFNETQTDNGLVGILWNSASGLAVDFNNGQVFFEICFTVNECIKGEKIEFTEDIISYDFSNNGADVQVQLIDGELDCEDYIISPTITDASCDNLCDGTIALDIMGWDIDKIEWSETSFPSTATVNNVCPGTYSVTVTYTNGREVTLDNIVVGSNPSVLITIDSVYAALNGNTGAIRITPSGGSGNYTYNYTPGNLDVEDPSNLAPGTYIIEVSDDSGCSTKDTVTILEVSADITGLDCADDTDGSASITVTGGSGNYTYSWSCTASTSNEIDNLPAGGCLGTVSDVDDGFSNFINLNIDAPAPIVITLVSAQDGNIDIDVSGGTPSYNYNWSSGDDTEDVTGLDNGIYSVTVTDANGCTAILSQIQLGEVDDVTEVTSLDSYNGVGVSCNGDCNGFINIIINNIENTTITWEDSNTSFERTDLCPGSYTYTVLDEDGEVVKTNTIVLTEPDVVSITNISTNCSNASNGSATITVTGGTSPFQYSVNGTDYQTSNTIDELGAQEYTVYVRDANGCEYSEQFTISSCGEAECLDGSPVITPNGDGKNDRFVIACVQDYQTTLEVYNKWGKKVYEESNYSNNWNGVSMDGNQLPEDTYFWVLKYSNSIRTDIAKGSITILRSLN